MQAYYCRFCSAWLLNSDAEVGRVEIECRSRRCGKRQTVFLGGRRTAVEIAQLQERAVGRGA